MKYESKEEKEQMVISYLGNILGEESFEKYKEFAKNCTSETYE